MSNYGQGYAQTRHLDPQAQAAADEFERQLADRERIQQMRNPPPLVDPWAGQPPPQVAPPAALVDPFPTPPDPMGGAGRVEGGGAYSMEIGDPEPLSGEGRVQGGGAYQMEIGEPEPLPTPQTQAPAPAAPSSPSPTPSQPGAGMPGATVAPTSSATQAMVAGQQAAQQMAPQGPPMPAMGGTGPQFALGGAGLGQRTPQVDVADPTDPRYRRASARADDDRQRRRQRILRTLGALLAARNIQSGGMGGVGVPLLVASGGVRPPSSEARLNADEERQQSAAQRLFEMRQAQAEAQREAEQFRVQQAERERAARMTEYDRAEGRRIQGSAEQRELDFRDPGSEQSAQARVGFRRLLALAPPEYNTFTDEELGGMSAFDIDREERAIRALLGNPARAGGGGARGSGVPGGLEGVETPPDAFVAQFATANGESPSSPSARTRQAATHAWQTMDEDRRARWATSAEGQQAARMLGRRIEGYEQAGGGALSDEQYQEARDAQINADQFETNVDAAIRAAEEVENMSAGRQIGARVGDAFGVETEDAVSTYNDARGAVIASLNRLMEAGVMNESEYQRWVQQLPSLSDPRQALSGTRRLRAARDRVRALTAARMQGLGYRRRDTGEPTTRTQPRRRAPQAGDVRFRANGRTYSIPREQAAAFLRAHPNAQRIGGGQ